MIEFVSYDGKYPNLCSGTLVLKVDGKTYELENILMSGGAAYFTDGYSTAHVEQGDWIIPACELPADLQKYEKEITDLVNSYVEHGCCGGCL